MAAGTPEQYLPKRDVSPLGASRFEQPYRPSTSTSCHQHASTAPNFLAAPTPPSWSSRSGANLPKQNLESLDDASLSIQPLPRPQTSGSQRQQHEEERPFGINCTPPSPTIQNRVRPTTSKRRLKPASLMETSPSTVGSDDFIYLRWDEEKRMSTIESPVCVVSPDDWFDRFNSGSSFDSSSEISKEDICPDRAHLAAVQDIPLYDSEGNCRTFGSFYDPATATHERQLIIFVRHFYCGACQAYLKALSAGISIQDYFSIPVPTSIIVVGCGQPELIPHYRAFTNCPFPMFADPSRKLFKMLGMKANLNIGRHRPEYMKDISPAAWAGGQFAQIHRSLKDPEGIRKRDVFRGGNMMQVGGEFLFEDGQVIWCHRMRNYRDHTEIDVLRQLLELDE